MLGNFDSAYGIRSVSLRYFNATSADPDGEIGEYHDAETHLVHLVIDAVLRKEPHVNILGTDYDTSDGTCIRDYVHVTDIADAHLHHFQYLQHGNPSTSLNFGTGRGYSVRVVISAVESAGNGIVLVQEMEEMERRPGDPENLVADASKAEKVLGWRLVHMDLISIVTSAITRHKMGVNTFDLDEYNLDRPTSIV